MKAGDAGNRETGNVINRDILRVKREKNEKIIRRRRKPIRIK